MVIIAKQNIEQVSAGFAADKSQQEVLPQTGLNEQTRAKLTPISPRDIFRNQTKSQRIESEKKEFLDKLNEALKLIDSPEKKQKLADQIKQFTEEFDKIDSKDLATQQKFLDQNWEEHRETTSIVRNFKLLQNIIGLDEFKRTGKTTAKYKGEDVKFNLNEKLGIASIEYKGVKYIPQNTLFIPQLLYTLDAIDKLSTQNEQRFRLDKAVVVPSFGSGNYEIHLKNESWVSIEGEFYEVKSEENKTRLLESYDKNGQTKGLIFEVTTRDIPAGGIGVVNQGTKTSRTFVDPKTKQVQKRTLFINQDLEQVEEYKAGKVSKVIKYILGLKIREFEHDVESKTKTFYRFGNKPKKIIQNFGEDTQATYIYGENNRLIASYEQEKSKNPQLTEKQYLLQVKETIKTREQWQSFQSEIIDHKESKISEDLKSKLLELGYQIYGLDQLAEEIEQQFGVDVEFRKLPSEKTGTSIGADQCDPVSIMRGLSNLNFWLNIYPPEFTENSGLKTVLIFENWRGTNYDAGGFSFGNGVIGIDNESGRTFHHEFFHCADFTDGGMRNDNEEWGIAKFGADYKKEYGLGGEWAIKTGLAFAEIIDDFQRAYGKFGGIDEDQATSIEDLFHDYYGLMERAKNDPELMAGVEVAKKFYYMVSEGKMDEQFWKDLASNLYGIDQEYWKDRAPSNKTPEQERLIARYKESQAINKLIEEDKKDEARTRAKKLITEVPDETRYARAYQELIMSGDKEETHQFYITMSEASTYPHYLEQLAKINLENREFDKLLSSREKLSKILPNDPQVTLDLAKAHERVGNQDRAVELTKKAIEQGYDSGDLISYMSTLATEVGEEKIEPLLDALNERAKHLVTDLEQVGYYEKKRNFVRDILGEFDQESALLFEKALTRWAEVKADKFEDGSTQDKYYKQLIDSANLRLFGLQFDLEKYADLETTLRVIVSNSEKTPYFNGLTYKPEAAEVFEKIALEVAQKNPKLSLDVAEYLKRGDQYSRSFEILEQIANENSVKDEVFSQLIDLYDLLPEAQQNKVKTIFEKYTKDVRSDQEIGKYSKYPKTMYEIKMAFEIIGQGKAAISFFEKARDQKIQLIESSNANWDTEYQLSEISMTLRDLYQKYDVAPNIRIDSARRALSLITREGYREHLSYVLASAYESGAFFEEAIEQYIDIIENDAGEMNAVTGIYKLRNLTEYINLEETVSILKKSIDHFGKTEGYENIVAMAQISLGETEKGIEMMEKVLVREENEYRDTGNNETAYFNNAFDLAEIYAENGYEEDAIELLDDLETTFKDTKVFIKKVDELRAKIK